MKNPADIDFEKIMKAIGYVKERPDKHLYLNDVAEVIGLSPDGFRQLFLDWAGVLPSEFFYLISTDGVRSALEGHREVSLFESPLSKENHMTPPDHGGFTEIIPMNDDEWRRLDTGTGVSWSFANTPFGKLLIASTSRGVCYMAFYDDEEKAIKQFKNKFDHATLTEKTDVFQQNALEIFNDEWDDPKPIRLHVKGTDFQLNVWRTLLKVPFGKLTTYSEMANEIGKPRAYRATGSAIARNWIAYIIPCHRVIQSAGSLGQYMWGSIRKNAIVGWEAAHWQLLQKNPLFVKTEEED